MVEDATEEAPERLGPWLRSALAGFGLVVLIAAVWAGLYFLVFGAVYLFGGHGTAAPPPIDRAAGLSLLAVPALMLALAGFCLFCTTWRRLAVVGCLAAALVADAGLALGFLHLANRPGEGRPAGMKVYPDEDSASKAHGFPEGSGTYSGPCSLGPGKCAGPPAKAK